MEASSPFSFPYKTKIIPFPQLQLDIEALESLDETIDQFFVEYEKSGRGELFEDHCPYFGNPWPSGISLALWTKENLGKFKNENVLEIGCGLAIPSLFLARNSVKVYATDIHPDVLPFLQRNAIKNHCSELEFFKSDWRKDKIPKSYSVIIGSDLVYDRSTPEILSNWLAEQLPENGFAIISDPGRPHWESFVKKIKEKSLLVEEFIFEKSFFVKVLKV